MNLCKGLSTVSGHTAYTVIIIRDKGCPPPPPSPIPFLTSKGSPPPLQLHLVLNVLGHSLPGVLPRL